MIAIPRGMRALVAALGVVVLAACGEDGTLRSPAAEVNGTRITDADVQAGIPRYEFLAGLQGTTCGTAVADETDDQACARFVLQNLIQQELLSAYAAANDLAVTASEVDQAIGPLQENLGGEEALRDRLAQDGLTLEDLHELAGDLLLIRTVSRDLAAGVVPEDELRAQYEERILEFTEIHTQHVLLETRAEALDIAGRATPENFEQLAREFSTDPSAAQNGGDLGLQPATQFVAEYSQAALDLEEGEISEPVRSQFGWHVIRLIDARVTPFEEVRDQLVGEAGGEAFQDWLTEQYADGQIRVNPRYGRIDLATGEITPIRSTSTTGAATPESPTGSAPASP
jgi:foldase protein PrsA